MMDCQTLLIAYSNLIKTNFFFHVQVKVAKLKCDMSGGTRVKIPLLIG